MKEQNTIIIPDNWPYTIDREFESTDLYLRSENFYQINASISTYDFIKLKSNNIDKNNFYYKIRHYGDTINNFKFNLDKLKNKPSKFGFAIDKHIIFLTDNPNDIVFTYHISMISFAYNLSLFQ